MATLDTDISEGLEITRDGEDYTVTLSLFAKDLAGTTILDKLAAAETLLGSSYDSVTYQGQVLPRQKTSLRPWPPVDTEILLTFAKDKTDAGGVPTSGDKGKALLSGGTSTELSETDFDADNLALAIASRTTIGVYYNPSGTALTGSEKKHEARVPIYNARSTFSFTRISMTDPSDDSRTFCGKTNSGTFFGMAANTVLCTSYTFEQQLDGKFRETISFAYDPLNFWLQFARYVLDDGKFPELDAAHIAAANGITIVTVQGEADFDAMAIVIYSA